MYPRPYRGRYPDWMEQLTNSASKYLVDIGGRATDGQQRAGEERRFGASDGPQYRFGR